MIKLNTSSEKKSIVFYSTKDGLKDLSIRTLYRDKDGKIWVGTLYGGVFQLAYPQQDEKFIQINTDNGLSSNWIEAIYQDHEGSYWFGTMGGLNQYTGNKFELFIPDKSKSQNSVWVFYEESNGNLLIGTTSQIHSGNSISSFCPSL